MEWIRNWLAQIQASLSRLALSQKLLIAAMLVMGLASLILVATWAASPAMSPLIDQPLDSGQQASITSYLASRNIEYNVQAQRIWVPTERRLEALAALQMQNLLPQDTSRGFAELIERQTWWQSTEQNRQLYNIALQNELKRVVVKMRGVSDAEVIISRPQATGFDATHQRPTASVNIVMASGRVNQHLAEAVAGLVSGAVAEMEPGDVTVIDALAGQQFRTRDDEQLMPTDFLELVQTQEKIYHDKISAALSYIPKVIVAVNVELDPKRVQTDATNYLKDSSITLTTRERTRTETSAERAGGGEPGGRANIGATISGAEGPGRQSSVEEAETEASPFAGVQHTTTLDPGGVPTRVSATVNVPRSYFVALFMQGKPEDTEPPDDAALQPYLDTYIQRIQKQVQPLISTREAGLVVVDVYPDDSIIAAQMATPQTASGGPIGMLVSGGMLRYVGLGTLALVAVFSMLLMLRKAAHPPPPVPSSEQLAGLPRSMVGSGVDLAGEADEADAALPGIELDDEQLAGRKIAEQVAGMVKNNPQEAANILRQWAKTGA